MTDRRTVMLVVIFLGTIALVSLALVGLLAYQGKNVPDALVATLSGTTGAVGALLAKTSTEPPA